MNFPENKTALAWFSRELERIEDSLGFAEIRVSATDGKVTLVKAERSRLVKDLMCEKKIDKP